jgi:CPA2 family monovalent cation:H+ antiporter-2
VVEFLQKKLPQRWLKNLEIFRRDSAALAQTEDWRSLTKGASIRLVANAVVVIAIFLLVGEYIEPMLTERLPNFDWSSGISLLIAILVSLPFLWGMALGKVSEAESHLWQTSENRRPLLVFEVARWVFTVSIVGFLALQFVSSLFAFSIVAAILVLLIFLLARHLGPIYLRLQNHFVGNLNEKEILSKSRSLPPLAPWDSHLVELTVSPDSSLIGKTLAEALIRERYGVTVALIERGHRFITSPGRSESLYPGDKLQIIGTDEQVQRFKAVLEPIEQQPMNLSRLEYALQSLRIEGDGPFVNKTIRDCGIREATAGLVVGIEKAGTRLLNPDSSTLIQPGDLLWIVGNRALLEQLSRGGINEPDQNP